MFSKSITDPHLKGEFVMTPLYSGKYPSSMQSDRVKDELKVMKTVLKLHSERLRSVDMLICMTEMHQ